MLYTFAKKNMLSFSTDSLLGKFRLIAFLEGVSYLILMFIAMPLKYLAGNLIVIKYAGWAHGLLFMAYCLLLLLVWRQYKWSFVKASFAFLASLLPFGTFVLEKRLQKEER